MDLLNAGPARVLGVSASKLGERAGCALEHFEIAIVFEYNSHARHLAIVPQWSSSSARGATTVCRRSARNFALEFQAPFRA
jgi:hypothetical protein